MKGKLKHLMIMLQHIIRLISIHQPSFGQHSWIRDCSHLNSIPFCVIYLLASTWGNCSLSLVIKTDLASMSQCTLPQKC